MANEHSQIVPSMQPTAKVADFKFWCQKVLPLVYDDSLSYYEVLNKMVVYLNQVIDNINADIDNIAELEDDFLLLQTYVNNFFDDIDQLVTYAERAEAAETSAISYAESAAESATNAASSAVNAATSSGSAATSALSAMDAKDAAVAAKTAAETALANAQTAATNAAASATAASDSATAASGSATNAAASAASALQNFQLSDAARVAAQSAATDANTSAENAEETAQSIADSSEQIAQNKTDIEALQVDVEHLNEAIENPETIDGSYAYFISPTDNIPIDSISVTYLPQQSGTGTPSAENPRPLIPIVSEGSPTKSLFKSNANLYAQFRTTSDPYTLSNTSIRFAWRDNRLAVWGGSAGNELSSASTAWKTIGSVYLNPGKYKFRVSVPSHSGSCDNGYFRDYDTGSTVSAIPLGQWKEITITYPQRLYMSFYLYHCNFNGSSSAPKYFTVSFIPVEAEETTEPSVRDNMTIYYTGHTPIYGMVHNLTAGKLYITHGYIASYAGEEINEPWVSSIDEYAEGTTPTLGAEVAYPLTEALEYDVDKIQVTPFLNENFISMYRCNITLTYGEYTSGLNAKIDANTENINGTKSMIATVLPSMKAVEPLSVNDFVIVGNKLYKVTANIASGGTLTVDTNVTETTIGAELTALLNA